MNLVVLLNIATIWLKKIYFLPKLNFNLNSKRNIPVKELRQLERHGQKVGKLRLDVKYFKQCRSLQICSEFLKFKYLKLEVYRSSNNLFQIILIKKLKELRRELKINERKYTSQKAKIFSKLSLIKKTCLILLLTEEFSNRAKTVIKTHHKKLLNLWKKQRNSNPDCIKNFSKRNLNILEEDALRYGRNHHSLPKKLNSYDTKANFEQLIYSMINENITLNSEIKDKITFAI